MPILHRRRIESNAPILHVDAQAAIDRTQFHPDLLALAITTGIVQAFLHNAENGVLQRRSEPVEIALVDKLNLRTAVPGLLRDQIVDRGDNFRLVEHRRPQAADQTASFSHRLAQERPGPRCQTSPGPPPESASRNASRA